MTARKAVLPSSPKRFGSLMRIEEEKWSSTSSSVSSKVLSTTSGVGAMEENKATTAEKRQEISPQHSSQQSLVDSSSNNKNHQSSYILEEMESRKQSEKLKLECEELEAIIVEKRREGRRVKMKTVLTISTYQNMIDDITREKDALQTKCRDLQEEITNLRRQSIRRLQDMHDVADGISHAEIRHVEGDDLTNELAQGR
jgi:hypothetical protein